MLLFSERKIYRKRISELTHHENKTEKMLRDAWMSVGDLMNAG